MVRAAPAAAVLLAAALLPGQGIVNASLLSPPARRGARAPSAALAARCGAAVVQVVVEVLGPPAFPIERPGSGVVVGPHGLVLTLRSLVRQAEGAADKRIVVRGAGAPGDLPAHVAAVHAPTGLALLQIDAPPAALPFLPLADAARARAGDAVLVLGRPSADGPVAFAGILAPAAAAATIDGQTLPPADIALTDAKIDRRCDGAALVDGRGGLLGICSAEHVHRDVAEPTLAELQAPSFGFAVTGSAIRRAFAAEFARPDLGNDTLAAPAAAAGPLLLPSLADAAAAVRPAVVAIQAGAGAAPAADPADPYATRRRDGVGSGVLVAQQGLLLTNRHLVAGRSPIRALLADGRAFAAEVLAVDTATNLALLRLDLPAGATVPAAALGDPAQAKLGAAVLAVGSPGAQETLTAGVLSQRRRGGRLQADPNLGNANAGGALVDSRGSLLGIVDGGEVDPIELAFRLRGDEAKTETNLSTAVGIDEARRVFAAQIDAEPAPGGPVRLAPAGADDGEGVTRMIAATAPALLNVYISWTSAAADEAANPFADQGPHEVHTESLGSGVVIDGSGLMLTNWHVVGAATEPDGSMRKDHVVHVRTFDGRVFPAEVLSISREDDLALLQLERPDDQPVPAVELGDSTALELGEPVFAIGNPHGFANTITAGVVSALDQHIQVKGRWASLDHLIETDAAINAGNSGGALLDLDGRLVGINSAGSHGFGSRGFAIPVDHVRKQTLGLLLTPEKLRSPDLGLRVRDEAHAVVVAAVDPRGPAQRAGIRPGDRLLALDGEPLTWSVGLALRLRRAAPGRALSLRLRRGAEERDVAVAPLSAGAWAVLRQTGLELGTLDFAAAPDLVRAACLAMHRRFTGDPRAGPAELPPSLPRVERVHDGVAPAGADVAAGDLLLGVELAAAAAAGDARRLRAFTTVDEVRACFDDPQLGSYDGALFRCWFCRAGEVRVVDLQARRLLP